MVSKIIYRALVQLSDYDKTLYLFRVLEDDNEYFVFANYRDFITSYTKKEFQECVLHFCDYFSECDVCFNENREYVSIKVLEKKELNIGIEYFDDLLWNKSFYL